MKDLWRWVEDRWNWVKVGRRWVEVGALFSITRWVENYDKRLKQPLLQHPRALRLANESLLLFILLALFIRLLMLAVTTKVSIEFQEIFWTVFILTMWWWRLYQLARLSCFFNLSVKILFISLWFVSVLCSADTMLLCSAVRSKWLLLVFEVVVYKKD